MFFAWRQGTGRPQILRVVLRSRTNPNLVGQADLMYIFILYIYITCPYNSIGLVTLQDPDEKEVDHEVAISVEVLNGRCTRSTPLIGTNNNN